MAAGGARFRSGPPPDPNALRRMRADDQETWETLPARALPGRAPGWPLPKVDEEVDDDGRVLVEASPSPWMLEQWRRLWKTPQAHKWREFSLHVQVAHYIVALADSIVPGSAAANRAEVRRFEDELGISVSGMLRHRWKFSEDEVGAKRKARKQKAAVAPAPGSARARLAAVE